MNRCECGGAREISRHTGAPGAPVVCTIERAGVAARVTEFKSAFEHLVNRERLLDGFRWVFRGDDAFARQLQELAAREHECCLFLTFTLSVDGELVTWEVVGAPEARGAIDVFFALPDTIDHDVDLLMQQAAERGLAFSPRDAT